MQKSGPKFAIPCRPLPHGPIVLLSYGPIVSWSYGPIFFVFFVSLW